MSRPALPAYPLTIYFDASCAICSAEMGSLKARDAEARLQLVDCSPVAFSSGPAPRSALMAAIHVYRLFTHFQVVIGTHSISQAVSLAGVVVTLVLSIGLFRESRR